jgi:hypothetical protein
MLKHMYVVLSADAGLNLSSIEIILLHYAKSRAASIGKKMQIISLSCSLGVAELLRCE